MYRFAGVDHSVYWFEARDLAAYEVLTMHQRASESGAPYTYLRSDRFGNRVYIGLYNPIGYRFVIGSDYYLSIANNSQIVIKFEDYEYVPNTAKNQIDSIKTSTYRSVFPDISTTLIRQKTINYTKLLDNCFDEESILPDGVDDFADFTDEESESDDELDDLYYSDFEPVENPVEVMYA